jgi:ubiquinone biosynthesis protein
VAFSEILRCVRNKEPERIARLGLDRNALAANLLWSILDQIFRLEFFHADPHPGNLLALPGNLVCFVDFGLVETMSSSMRQKQLEFLSALYNSDFERVYRALIDILESTSSSDVEGFRREFLALSHAWERDKDVAPGPENDDWPLSNYMAGVMRAARENRLRVPPTVLSMYRSLLTGEIISHSMGSASDLRSVGAAFFQSMQKNELLRLIDPSALQKTMLDVLSLLRDGPGNLHRVLSDLADERLILPVKVAETRHDQLQANNRSRLTTAAIAFLAVAVLIVGVRDLPLSSGPHAAHLLWLIEFLLGLLIVVLWRRLS